MERIEVMILMVGLYLFMGEMYNLVRYFTLYFEVLCVNCLHQVATAVLQTIGRLFLMTGGAAMYKMLSLSLRPAALINRLDWTTQTVGLIIIALGVAVTESLKATFMTDCHKVECDQSRPASIKYTSRRGGWGRKGGKTRRRRRW